MVMVAVSRVSIILLKVNKKQAIYGPMVYLCQLANLKT